MILKIKCYIFKFLKSFLGKLFFCKKSRSIKTSTANAKVSFGLMKMSWLRNRRDKK